MSSSISQLRSAAQAGAAADGSGGDGSAALSTLALPPTLSRIEGHRVLSVLQKAIERLKLLSLLDADHLAKATAAQEAKLGGGAGGFGSAASTATSNTAASAAAAAATAAAAPSAADGAAGTTTTGESGIAAILQEQARLEARYDSLVAASKARKGRNPNDPVLDAACFAHVPDTEEVKRQQELQEVASSLKAHSKMLCRLLKDNPCDADNWRKVVMERADLVSALETCARELAVSCQPPAPNAAPQAVQGLPGSYKAFADKVVEDQAASAWADGLVRKERETNQNVKQLQNEVKTERAQKEAEIEQRQAMISTLKADLTALRNSVRAKLDQLRAQTEAASEAQAREALNQQRLLRERLERLKVLMADERAISQGFKHHTLERSERIDNTTAEWTQKAQDALKAMQNEKADREKAAQREADRLQTTRERCDAELLSAKSRHEQRKELEVEKRGKEDLALARYAAATKVQAAIKAFFTRQVLVGLKKKALKKNRRAAVAAASATSAPAPKPGRR